MSNKYIEKFILLTEQNILANPPDMVNENAAQRNLFIAKYNGYIKCFCGALVLVGLVYLLFHTPAPKIVMSKIILPKTNKVKIVAALNEPILRSVIPKFNTHAHKQILQQVALKRLDLTMAEDSDLRDNFRQQAHVTDKVLVVPKSFG